MMRYLIPGILVAALATGMAIAQSQTPSRSPARDNSIPPATNQNPGLQAPPEVRPGEPARATNPGGVPAPLGSTTPEPTTLVAAIHSDDLLDATVRNDRNQSIGTVEALLISPDGKVAGVVLDVGGFLGVGARQVVVRMDQISMVGKDVRLNQGSKESLQTLPPYQRRGTTK
jgi:hypothetical protein